MPHVSFGLISFRLFFLIPMMPTSSVIYQTPRPYVLDIVDAIFCSNTASSTKEPPWFGSNISLCPAVYPSQPDKKVARPALIPI
ncbi:hypothetical protein EDB81DRAFT_788005 [Dactylonectria macrodidyma]|uniref:Secreted protein n=1 Tax=Dactylonectria macrodidyma TaxID=307937 RepID=A0A9P9F9R9_9HYPO|nr:hypothetical protein EDB81DRAFT_788005 [Dactylonectria macrodidyma]